jgi:hypothetical protein
MADVVWSLATQRPALTFWSEQWLARETLLTRIVERVRSTRIATALDVDEGWYGTRDVSLQLWRWGRLDVQMLVEEHAGGRVLIRIARRLRVTPFFIVTALSLLAIGFSVFRAADIGSLAAAWLVVTVTLVMRALWQAASMMTLADRVMTSVLLEADAIPLGVSATAVAARLDARTRSGVLSLGLRERTQLVAAASLPPIAGSARHAS